MRPNELLRFVSLLARSGMLACPTMMAPAALNFATTVASCGATSSWPGAREALPAGRGHLALDAGVRLDDDRHAPERPAGAAALRGLGVLARGLGERLAPEHRLDRAVDAVVAIDAIEVPLHDLRDGVLLVRVEPMQLRHRDVQQVAVDRGLRRQLGRTRALTRRGKADAGCDRDDD